MNIYALQTPESNCETFATLHQDTNIKIQAIRSYLSEPGKIYDQDQDEWVVLLHGNAQLKVADKIIQLNKGDSVFLQRHTIHQVLSTSKDALWLGIFSH